MDGAVARGEVTSKPWPLRLYKIPVSLAFTLSSSLLVCHLDGDACSSLWSFRGIFPLVWSYLVNEIQPYCSPEMCSLAMPIFTILP